MSNFFDRILKRNADQTGNQEPAIQLPANRTLINLDQVDRYQAPESQPNIVPQHLLEPRIRIRNPFQEGSSPQEEDSEYNNSDFQQDEGTSDNEAFPPATESLPLFSIEQFRRMSNQITAISKNELSKMNTKSIELPDTRKLLEDFKADQVHYEEIVRLNGNGDDVNALEEIKRLMTLLGI